MLNTASAGTSSTSGSRAHAVRAGDAVTTRSGSDADTLVLDLGGRFDCPFEQADCLIVGALLKIYHRQILQRARLCAWKIYLFESLQRVFFPALRGLMDGNNCQGVGFVR